MLIFFIFLFQAISITWADSNGIWIDAKDVKAGIFGEDENSGDFIFPSNLDVYDRLSTNEAVVSGNLGVGTTSPSSKLDVRGETNTQGLQVSKNEEAIQIVGTDHTYIRFYPKGTSSGLKGWIGYGTSTSSTLSVQSEGGNIALNPYGGFIGIGTLSPSAKLDVNGDISGGDIYSNGNLLATQDYVDANDDVGITVETDPQWNSQKSNYATKTYVNSQSISKPSLSSCNDGDALVYSSVTNTFNCGSTGSDSGPIETSSLFSGGHTVQECTNNGGTVEGSGSNKFCRFSGSSCPAGWTQHRQWSETSSVTCSDYTSCTTGSHIFSDNSQETCTYRETYIRNDRFRTIGVRDVTCFADIRQIGCI